MPNTVADVTDFDAGIRLLGIIDEQGNMIAKQNEVIAKLVIDNMEKENLINTLMEGCDGFF